MTELVLTRGLPASGKTTWARAWVAEDPEHRARCNRDDLRSNLYGMYWGLSREQEEAVTSVQHAAVLALLLSEKSVVVDDTNLIPKYAQEWQALANKLSGQFRLDIAFRYEDSFLQLPLTACIARDTARQLRGERGVGHKVITAMHQEWSSHQ